MELYCWMLDLVRASRRGRCGCRARQRYAEHCRVADEQTRPLNCVTYCNGHGEAEAGSLAYMAEDGGTRLESVPRQALSLSIRAAS